MKSCNLLGKSILLILFLSAVQLAQNSNLPGYQYISPVPGSSMILPETNLIIREGNFINPMSLSSKKIKLVGSKSGIHSYNIKLSDDGKTIIIKPFSKFSRGETVYVEYSGGISTIKNGKLPNLNFQFQISESDPALIKNRSMSDILELNNAERNNFSNQQNRVSNRNLADKFPDDFPAITINNSNNPSPGYYFIAPFFDSQIPLGYLMILDNTGIPIFYQRTLGVKADWKVQPNGLITYFDFATSSFYAMDSSYSIVDTFYTGNGYTTDIHELRLLPNYHALLFAYDRQIVRMDTIVEGGNPQAIVDGLIIQEIDANKDVVFQWRSWDHFKFTDATNDINLTAYYFDYVHGNAIEIDRDGNLLISCRNMDEITKINLRTGDIIWRWGGLNSRNNEFRFRGDHVTFSHQHHIRLLPNGNYTLFDNGNLHNPVKSRGLEYRLDQINKVAELVWDFQYDPLTFSFAMGNVQRLKDDNTVIGWGWSWSDIRALTELKNDGSIALELSLPDTAVNYRAFKFPWKTNLFVTNPDSIFFDSVYVGDSLSTTVDIINNSQDSLTITGFYNVDSAFSVKVDSLPFIIPPLGSYPITINFIPKSYGYYNDILHIRSDTDTSRIVQVMVMTGQADTINTGIKDRNNVLSFRLDQNYPNPFNPVTTIEYEIPQREFVSLSVFDIRGREVANLVNEEKPGGSYNVKFDASNLSTGIYFYRLQAGDFFEVKKLLLLK